MAKPTHYLYVKRKDGKSKAMCVGAGWMNEEGWISVQLNPCVTLTDREDVYINLYPARDDGDEEGKRYHDA